MLEWEAEEKIEHVYTSTGCMHQLHDKCKLNCKYCGKPCNCYCHVRM